MLETKCVLCRSDCKYTPTVFEHGREYDVRFYVCPDCGKYVIGPLNNDWDDDKRFRLACLIREHRLQGGTKTVGLFDVQPTPGPFSIQNYLEPWWQVDELLAEFPKPTEIIDRALHNLSRHVGESMEAVALRWEELSFLMFCQIPGASTLFRTMVKRGFLHEVTSNRSQAVFSITVDGWERLENKEKEAMVTSRDLDIRNKREVFVVHGHDGELRSEVCRLLEKLDLEPVVLFEQPDKGRTIIEKFEQHSDVGYAVVLLTPDDEGRVCGDEQLMPRARQNVVFELGFFYGKLRRKNVCALLKEGLEFPSDINGVIYKRADHAGAWRLELAREMQAAGLDIDLNKLA